MPSLQLSLGWVLCLLCVAVPALPEPEPDPRSRGYIGVQVTQNEFVTVANVLPNTPAEKAGLREGDGILKIGRFEPRSVNEVIGLIAVVRPGEIVNMEVRRGEETVPIRIKVAARPDDLLRPPPPPSASDHGKEKGPVIPPPPPPPPPKPDKR